MKLTQLVSPLLFSLALASATSACVTVNVNFPEAAVQSATDDYVRDLYRAKEKGRAPAPASTTEAPSAKPSGKPASKTSLFESLFISEAFAAENAPVFKVASSKSAEIRDKMAARLDKVLDGKRSGQLGETNDGWLSNDPTGKLKPLLKKSMQPVVDAENADRKDLYNELLSVNGISKNRIKDIQKSFAHSFQAESPAGTWLQNSDGKWEQKP